MSATIVVSEPKWQEVESATLTWTLTNWRRRRDFLQLVSEGAALQLGDAKFRFYLERQEVETAAGSVRTSVYPFSYYSLWVELMSGEEKVNARVVSELSPAYYRCGTTMSYLMSAPVPTSVVTLKRAAEFDPHSKKLVRDKFLTMGNTSGEDGGRIRFEGDVPDLEITITTTILRSRKALHLLELRSFTDQIGTLLVETEEDGGDKFCDVLLQTKDGVKLPAHRAILSARSPVFRAMLSSGMQETVNLVVPIPNLGSPAVKILLKHIYKDTVDDSWKECVEEVLEGANMYDLPKLMDHLDKNMIQVCSTGNVPALFKMAKLHGLKTTLKKLEDFAHAHMSEVLLGMGTEESR